MYDFDISGCQTTPPSGRCRADRTRCLNPSASRVSGRRATAPSSSPCLAQDKASQEGCSGRFRRLAGFYQSSRPKPFQELLRSFCYPHSRQPFLSAVRRTLFEVSRCRRLPFWVGERVFGEAKKGRGFFYERSLPKALSMIRELAASKPLRVQALSYSPAQCFR
jgi:hypothetical protein